MKKNYCSLFIYYWKQQQQLDTPKIFYFKKKEEHETWKIEKSRLYTYIRIN